MEKVKYRLIQTSNDITVILGDGGIATISSKEEDEGNLSMSEYYQERFTQKDLESEDPVWDAVGEGKMYYNEWKTPFDDPAHIQDALGWLAVGAEFELDESIWPDFENNIGIVLADAKENENDIKMKEISAERLSVIRPTREDNDQQPYKFVTTDEFILDENAKKRMVDMLSIDENRGTGLEKGMATGTRFPSREESEEQEAKLSKYLRENPPSKEALERLNELTTNIQIPSTLILENDFEEGNNPPKP